MPKTPPSTTLEKPTAKITYSTVEFDRALEHALQKSNASHHQLNGHEAPYDQAYFRGLFTRNADQTVATYRTDIAVEKTW